MLATRLEYQSWLIETSCVNILIDPWLTREDLLVSYPWVLRRPHSKRSNPSILHGLDIHVILLTSHFEDHLHINSLLSLPKETLCVGTKKAVKKIQHHGFNNCLSIQAESKTDIGAVEIKALKSGFPYSYNSLAFLIKDKSKDKSLLLEPHVLNKSTIKHCFNLSALITTIESVKLLGLELSMNPYKTMTYLKNLKPDYFLPSGTAADKVEGILKRFLYFGDLNQDLEKLFKKDDIPTKIACTQIGEKIDL